MAINMECITNITLTLPLSLNVFLSGSICNYSYFSAGTPAIIGVNESTLTVKERAFPGVAEDWSGIYIIVGY